MEGTNLIRPVSGGNNIPDGGTNYDTGGDGLKVDGRKPDVSYDSLISSFSYCSLFLHNEIGHAQEGHIPKSSATEGSSHPDRDSGSENDVQARTSVRPTTTSGSAGMQSFYFHGMKNLDDILCKDSYPILNNSTWSDWYRATELHMKSLGLWTQINGGKPRENLTRAEEMVKWDRNDASALFIIHLSCNATNRILISNCKTARDAWNCLKAIHCPHSVLVDGIVRPVLAGSDSALKPRVEDFEKLSDYLLMAYKHHVDQERATVAPPGIQLGGEAAQRIEREFLINLLTGLGPEHLLRDKWLYRLMVKEGKRPSDNENTQTLEQITFHSIYRFQLDEERAHKGM
ncbi:hypothetical protein H072_9027 [Dactylellina haptotyla CBS 200.50]|uniref:Uncharacterized protein n=1 Tax=Dactylellina haptotyla (strain CBS 200.50) TaxID=1284197 RepID=S8A2J1_DACHA|nr:hypothetical protein H072_9027 [Dactylellina haptotyla CBS 200.50]